MNTTVNNNNIEIREGAKAERQERYNARCKELEAEALAQMPYKVGDTVKIRDGVTGRVVEMYPEITGDTDNPHLIYEYDGKPTVNVVILDADGKRHCAHWSFFTLQEASEIKPKATDSELESLTAKYAKQIEEYALLGCGCMVGDGDETRKDSKCVKVRTAYKNDSHDTKDWTYCVSWYNTVPIKGDADGQRQTLRECENGVTLKQAARAMAIFEQEHRKAA